MKPSAADKREIIPLLEKDYDDVDALAEELLAKAFFLYEQKPRVGVLFRQDDTLIVVDDFSGSKLDVAINAAIKWAAKQGLAEGEAVLTVIKTQEQV